MANDSGIERGEPPTTDRVIGPRTVGEFIEWIDRVDVNSKSNRCYVAGGVLPHSEVACRSYYGLKLPIMVIRDSLRGFTFRAEPLAWLSLASSR